MLVQFIFFSLFNLKTTLSDLHYWSALTNYQLSELVLKVSDDVSKMQPPIEHGNLSTSSNISKIVFTMICQSEPHILFLGLKILLLLEHCGRPHFALDLPDLVRYSEHICNLVLEYIYFIGIYGYHLDIWYIWVI